jgi:hypothetical protein
MSASTISESPTPSSSKNSPTSSPTPTLSLFNATSFDGSSSSSSTLAPGSIAAIVIFVLIFIGIFAFFIWRRRMLAASETTTTNHQFSSPRYGGGGGLVGAHAHARHGAVAPPLDSGNRLFQWFAVTTARLCPNVTPLCAAAPPRRQGHGGGSAGATAIGTAATSASSQQQFGGGASRNNNQQQNGANPNPFGLRQTQAQQSTPAQRFTAAIRTLFGGARMAQAPPELRANALPINLNSRNFQVSNPLARKS